MCGKADVEGRSGLNDHVVEIRGDELSWLPAGWRAEAQGEYTFLCLHCDSFPDRKWPRESGAWSAMQMHLGQAHYIGQFKGLGGQRIGMVKAT
jgi:hypothetical protein